MNFKSIKEMKKTITILIIVSFSLIGVLLFSIYNQNLTGSAVEDYHSYTKAICDENNFCQDYEITCDGENLINMNPITGASVQNPDDWKDPRGEDERNNNGLCNVSK